MVRWVTRLPGATVTAFARASESPSSLVSKCAVFPCFHVLVPRAARDGVDISISRRVTYGSAPLRSPPSRIHNAKCFSSTSNFSRRRTSLAPFFGEPFVRDRCPSVSHSEMRVPLHLRLRPARRSANGLSRLFGIFFFNTVRTDVNEVQFIMKLMCTGYKNIGRRYLILKLVDRHFVTLRHTRISVPESPILRQLIQTIDMNIK